jgi:ABC-type antimicrobial peptide transport system permease subunit
MLDEGNAQNLMETPDAPPPEPKNNRTFLIVGGIMAGLVFLTLVCMAVYFLVISPRLAAQRSAAQATIEAGNAQAVQQLTQTAQAALFTATPQNTPIPLATGTPVPPTLAASATPIIAQNTEVSTPTNDPATLAALQTQLAFQMTSTGQAGGIIGTQTALAGGGMPTTGFFDEVGLPTLIILAVALIAVIFLARRMRKAPSK